MPERLLMKADGFSELRFCIFMSSKSGRQREVGSGTSRDVGVDHQRQNGMKEGSRGEFDLSPFHEPPVQGHNLLDRGALQCEHFLLILFGEAAIFLAQLGQSGILVDGAVSEPGQIVPNLKIQEFLC